MKTTVEISDPLLEDARRLAAREGTTLRDVLERGLRQVVASSAKSGRAFRLRDASVGGKGLRPDAAQQVWNRLREMTYEGRGGR